MEMETSNLVDNYFFCFVVFTKSMIVAVFYRKNICTLVRDSVLRCYVRMRERERRSESNTLMPHARRMLSHSRLPLVPDFRSDVTSETHSLWPV